MKYIFIILAFFCFILSAEDSKTKAADNAENWLYLSTTARKSYNFHAFESLQKPSKELRVEKLKTTLPFYGFMDKSSSPLYFAEYPPERYAYLVPPNFESSESLSDLPIIFSKRSRKVLLQRLKDIELGTPMTLYGILKKGKSRRSSAKERFCFMVVDAYLGEFETAASNEGTNKKERIVNLETRFINFRLKHLINRKLAFTATFEGRKSETAWYLTDSDFQSYSHRKYIQISCADKSLASCTILIPREQENTLRTLFELMPNDRIELTAAVMLQSSRTSSQTASYILVVQELEKALTTSSPNNIPESTEENWDY